MYRQALRSTTPRAAAGALRQSLARSAPRRFASTSPADKPRTWKGSALRWGLAGAALYYYNTSNAFSEDATSRLVPEPPHFADSDLKTVDAVIEEKRQKTIAKVKESAPTPAEAAPAPAAAGAEAAVEASSPAPEAPQHQPGSPEALEEEAGQQGAFNPETGEINWDCPCLGGMADGPCGEEFKSAFSCFVFSTEEPKGMDCIEKFQGMQECFRKYPEIYSAELADDEEVAEGAPVPTESSPSVNADGDAVAAPEKVTPRASIEEKVQEKAAESPATETNPDLEVKVPQSTSTSADVTARAEASAKVPAKAIDATAENEKSE